MALSNSEEQDLVRELAQQVVEIAAPEELLVFDETAEEYFADPEGVLKARGKDEAVGFGLELALLTPYILAVVTPVIQLLADMVGEALKSDGQPSVSGFIRRLLHRPTAESTSAGQPPAALTRDQLGLVHNIALERGRGLGLPEAQAAVLADAIAGGVAVAAGT
jgi:hypothetical protein